MSNEEIGAILLTLSVLVTAVHVLGFIVERLRQPRLVGEIIAGVLLGPYVLGKLWPSLQLRLFSTPNSDVNKTEIILAFLYWTGLFLLMFLSGSETRRLMAKENRREIIYFLAIGTTLPFLIVMALGTTSLLPLDKIIGSMANPLAAVLVLAVAVSVTSIPVISRIFIDLKIIQTRFASLVLGFAVLEDIALWGALTVATGIAGSTHATQSGLAFEVVEHLSVALLYMLVGLLLAPKVLAHIHNARWNLLIKASPVGYLFCILFVYAAIAAALGVNLIFAAFLAGFGLVGGIQSEQQQHDQRQRFSLQLDSIHKVAAAIFIPIYFAMVGYKLVLGRGFSFSMLIIFLVGSSAVAIISFACAARAAGFRGLEILNLSIAKNARGGPGIVLASVAYETGIINAVFYTTLVLTAILTSQATSVWLSFVLSKGLPLLKVKN